MRTFNHIYESEKELLNYIDETKIDSDKVIMVRIHSAIHTAKEMKTIVNTICTRLPLAQIIGASTSQIILGGSLISDKCLISFSDFNDAEYTTISVSCLDEDNNTVDGKVLAEKILVYSPNVQNKVFCMIFFPLFYRKIEAVIDTINEKNSNLFLLGGTAYTRDKLENEPPYVISNNTVSDTDVSVMFISLPNGFAHSDYACGVETVGIGSVIKTNEKIIETVNGIPGADWYSNHIGKDELKNNPTICDAFPIIIQGRERNIPYHVNYLINNETNEYYIESLAELPDGASVTPSYFRPQKIFDEISDIVKKLSNFPCESVFAYDCVARAALLSNCAHWEIENFKSTNMSGCLLSGEIITRKGTSFYANYTFVLTTLSENKDARIPLQEPDISSLQHLQSNNLSSLNLLLATSARSLNDELNYQKNMIRDAVFYNPAVGIDNQLKFQYDKDIENLNKVAILYLNNEKMLRLFSGVTETYGYLTDCYQKLLSQFTAINLHMYSFQDTSLIIAANESLSEAQFETIIDNIQEFLNSQVYGDIHLSYIAVTLFDSKDPLSQLELALDYAKSKQVSRIHFNEIKKDIEKEQRNLHILIAIRDAISHNGVIPYFQEIHSNYPGKPRLFESLMRIKDENGIIYYPDTFLPISKEYSLYDKLSELMISTVMDMFLDKKSRVTLNLNVQDIYNRNMLKLIFDKLALAPNPSNFIFEIVESEEVTDYEYIKSFADRIHELGGKIAIDDFGSGFSNFLHIMRIDADFIKIDGNVIREILHDPLVPEFVEMIHGWCIRNKQSLICEYVENEEIQKYMERIGVEYSQGYLYSKPHPWSQDDE